MIEYLIVMIIILLGLKVFTSFFNKMMILVILEMMFFMILLMNFYLVGNTNSILMVMSMAVMMVLDSTIGISILISMSRNSNWMFKQMNNF